MFKYLTAKEFEALSEYQQEKYLDEKREHEAKIAKEEAEKAGKEAAQKLIDENKEATEKATQEAIDKAIGVVKDEYDKKIEKAQADMNRAKEKELEMRGIKTMRDEIEEKLSTEEGESMLKEFIRGNRSKLDVNLESKAVLKPTGAAGSGVAPQFANIVGPGHDTFHARQAIPVYPTTSDLIKYVQFTVDPDADGYKMTGEGDTKGKLGYIPAVKDAPVRKIAGLLDVSDEINDDIVGIRAFWAAELPQAYFDAEDLQVFKGDGTGQNLLGLWYQASSQSLPLGSVTSASNHWDKIAAAITEVRRKPIKRNVTASYISPVAYMELLLNKSDGSGDYDYPIIMGNDGILRVGDVPVMWSNVFEDAEGVLGDFARGTAIFQRKEMNIRYSEENKDNFEKNLLTIRLEGREALPIYYPESFKKLVFGPATT
ncbi:phage major capsid protein [Sphingobacterium sp. ML3W]|uniref:phage major capsid protein n=1 Tax=Sphingobacterium sp. ML3W TaxID=1538644 RepID=UPI00249B7BA6|nr:phage major capsid protein [Sphingobacterium sp. ML3W]WFA79654.1 phage major capsid protein [Sphingobacterium sp. ML3W]